MRRESGRGEPEDGEHWPERDGECGGQLASGGTQEARAGLGVVVARGVGLPHAACLRSLMVLLLAAARSAVQSGGVSLCRWAVGTGDAGSILGGFGPSFAR